MCAPQVRDASQIPSRVVVVVIVDGSSQTSGDISPFTGLCVCARNRRTLPVHCPAIEGRGDADDQPELPVFFTRIPAGISRRSFFAVSPPLHTQRQLLHIPDNS